MVSGSLAAAAVLSCGVASAQSPFPSRPVHIFVPYAAGGGVDVLARTLAMWSPGNGARASSSKTAGAGSGGLAGARDLAARRLHPDRRRQRPRHNAFLYPKLPCDTFKDFTPISLLASSPNILLVKADLHRSDA